MIDFYYWPTPNGWKVSIMLEECGLSYRLRPVNIGRGEQFEPEFLRISPNNRMPAIADICAWPWVLIAKPLGQPLDEFPNVSRWRRAIKGRPAVQRGVDLGKEHRRRGPPSDEERRILFGQTAATGRDGED